MRRTVLLAALCSALASTEVSAGVFTDDMSRCLVAAATPQDQVTLVKSMFSTFALNPDLAGLATITDGQRDQIDQAVVDLYERLLLKDCHSQTVAALKNEGAASMQQSFGVLGQVAARGLMANPSAVKGMQGLQSRFRKDAFIALMNEAGIPAP